MMNAKEFTRMMEEIIVSPGQRLARGYFYRLPNSR